MFHCGLYSVLSLTNEMMSASNTSSPYLNSNVWFVRVAGLGWETFFKD